MARVLDALSLSRIASGRRVIENRAMLLLDVGALAQIGLR
jgi:hypothetical protein